MDGYMRVCEFAREKKKKREKHERDIRERERERESKQGDAFLTWHVVKMHEWRSALLTEPDPYPIPRLISLAVASH